MVKIADTKPGRTDGGYARLFDNPELGAIMSRVHSACIQAGRELEKIVKREAKVNGIAIPDLDEFLRNGNGHDGVFVATKNQIKACKTINFPQAEPLRFEQTDSATLLS